MYPGVELRLLRYAVIVAEELNFRRAAESLYVSQPTLSRQIRQLEDFLGFKLFERNQKHVEITRAGRKFLAEAKKALHYSNRAIEAGKEAEREGREALAIGYCAYVELHFLSMLRHMKPVSAIYPAYRSSSTSEIVSRLLSHEWHAGLVILPITKSELAVKALLREPIAVAIPDSHPLAQQPRIELHDLANEPLILPPRRVNPQFHDLLIARFKNIGIRPGAAQEVVNSHEALHLALEGLGIPVVQSSASYAHTEGVAVRDIADADLTIETGIASNPENTSETLTLFLAAVEQMRDQYLKREERKPPQSA